jgi:ketosteroid isomerase-like protein
VSENLDLVRSIYADWERGDFSRADWADPQIEYVVFGGPAPGTWTGLAGMTEGEREFLGSWEDYRVQADAYREFDAERILVHTLSTGRGKLSGMEFPQAWTRGAVLFHIRDGRVARLVVSLERDRFLADLGLEE